MDLRPHIRTNTQIETAKRVLNYQPFMITDDVQTGAAYSWLHCADPRVAPPLLFNRGDGHDWEKITDANRRLAAIYDDLLDEVAGRFPGGSLIDIACNNGYFPVGAELRGMRGYGVDANRRHGHSITFLNSVLGTRASFARRVYNPVKHRLQIWRRFDVVAMSAIMCHLPDPLHFLAACARVAKRAILFWGQVVDSDNLLIAYRSPHPSLSTFKSFPACFNDNTRISMGLFRQSMDIMGFKEIIEIQPRETWLADVGSRTLEEELGGRSRHVALLALR
jgi:SAM-dependent methyltransferase